MKVTPKVRGFICTTAHPTGCEAAVRKQIDYVKTQPKTEGPKKVLVIGSSMGYGLASRIAAAYSCGAATIGVMFDRPASGNKTATSGWYNTKAFEKFAVEDGLYAKTINGDAYSDECKKEVIELIKSDLGKVDMVVYSLAAPRRTVGDTVYSSVLKTTGESYTNKTIDLRNNCVSEITIEPATEEEITATVKTASEVSDGKRVTLVFEPHTYSRLKSLLNGFAQSLAGADRVIVAPVFAAREKPPGDISAGDLVREIENSGTEAVYIDNFLGISEYLSKTASDGETVVFTGAGDIDKAARLFVGSHGNSKNQAI